MPMRTFGVACGLGSVSASMTPKLVALLTTSVTSMLEQLLNGLHMVLVTWPQSLTELAASF